MPDIQWIEIGPCRLACGDCESVLPTLEPSSVDLVITSPPYNLGNTTGGGFPLGHYSSNGGITKRSGMGKWRRAAETNGLANGYGSHDDNMPHDEYVEWQRAVVRECWRIIRPDGAIFYNHKSRILGGLLVTPFEYLPAGVQVRQIVVWQRAGGINFSPAFYLPTHEWVMVIAPRDFRLKSKGASGVGDVWYIPQESNTEHPAPFPLDLPLKILETTTGETVCDPFMGSATTGIACIKSERQFIGIENDPQWFDLACRNLRRAWEDKCSELPFAPPPRETQPALFGDTGDET